MLPVRIRGAPRENDSGVIYRWGMETTDTTGWWACAGCGVDAELDVGLVEAELTGCAVPCPDCGEPMTERQVWEVAA